MIKKISYERRVYESVDDNSLSKAISQKTNEKNKSCNKGLTSLHKMLTLLSTLAKVSIVFNKSCFYNK